MKTALIVFAVMLYSCATNSQNSPQLTIKDAVHLSAREIIAKNNIQGSLAVISINSLSNELSAHIIRLFENRLVDIENANLITRQRIETVLAEQNFGKSGFVDDNSAQKIGHILGADFVLTGDLTKPEDQYYLNLQIIRTETAVLVYSNTFEIKNSELKGYEKNTTVKPAAWRF